ncbi:hypothetical protein EV363DRAFT_1450562 [Boletus edulis]|nr:hypothetical protein EV363DRAFT_1450562 [Boletus edulis]
MVKRKIIYESEDDDNEDRSKKSRTAPEKEQQTSIGARRSECSGRGSGGRLAQMKQFKQKQTERLKRPSKIDIATQDEDINPMAPASQHIGSRKKTSASNGAAIGIASRTLDEPNPQATLQSLRPEFSLATPGQQFGFRLPATASQMESDTRAPSRAHFPGLGVSSQSSSTSSAPPSSRSASLFLGQSLGGTSTAPTSRAPSVSSSACGRHATRQPNPVLSSQVPVSRTSSSSSCRANRQYFGAGDEQVIFTPRAPTPLQRTASFYSQPISMNAPGHSLSTAPSDYEGNLQIDEVSPSEDEMVAEKNLHQDDVPRAPSPSRLPRGNVIMGYDVLYFRYVVNCHPTDDNNNNNNNVASFNRTNTQYQRQDAPRPPANQVSRQRNGHTQPDSAPVQHTPHPAEDILTTHRRRNRAPRLPSNSQLLANRQQQTLSTDRTARETLINSDGQGGTDTPLANLPGAPRLPSNSQQLTNRQQQASSTNQTACETLTNGGGQDGTDAPPTDPLAPSNPRAGYSTERSEPWQLQYYDPPTHNIIERAKQFSHCDAASINSFPVRAEFNSKATEYIKEAIAECQSHGLIISDGWWPKHVSSLTRLLWEDLGNWRSALRKKAHIFVTQRYQWDPQNRRKQNIEIAKRLIGNGGLFLRDGSDAEGHANNLAHPALSGLIIEFFYTGPAAVGKLFSEVFVKEVLRVTVALAVTALKVVLDELASGQEEVNFRVPTYMPVYTEILGLMSKCDTSDIHCAKTKALWTQWAQIGSNGIASQESGVTHCGFDVDLD